MAVHDGGGTFASGWSGAPVPTMWAALSGYDSAPHWKMAGAWKQSYELLLAHIGQVKQYRENLATAWPPHKSKASAAYVRELDGLIDNLQETYEAAMANHQALSTATSAISAARRELDVIQQEFTRNAGLLADYNADNPTPAGTGGSEPTRTPSPSPQAPPVAPTRQSELQRQAASIMNSLSAELATAQTSFIAPRPYSSSIVESGGEDFANGGGSGGGIGGGGIGGGAGGGPAGITPRSITPPDSSTGRTTVPDTHIDPTRPDDRGPTLVETDPTTNPINPTNPTNTTTPVPSGGGGGGGGGGGPYTFTPSGPGSGRFTPSSTTGTAGFRGSTFPSNGVIGGSPISGGGAPGGIGGRGGQSGTGGLPGGPGGVGGRGGQRVNPAGGVIGGSKGTTGMTPGGLGGQPTRRGTGRNDEDPQNRRWDPDNPWETDDGVDPVLLPAQERRIDPGPTIGGR